MVSFSVEIKNALKKLNFSDTVIKLSEHEYNLILQNVLKIYTSNEKYSYPLWDVILDEFSIKHEDSWSWVKDFKPNNTVILFFEPLDEKVAFSFPNKQSLVDTLEECFGFVFYLTDQNFSYLICHNDHDYLITTKSAKKWLKTMFLDT